MNILIASDKFKGSLTAEQVCAAIRSALLKLDASLVIKTIPLADGGEGTASLLTVHTHGSWVTAFVYDPLFRKIQAGYGISGDGSTAFIEMSQASGLQLLAQDERNPLKTSTYGTGELIANAIDRGARKIVLAIGGSATNDAGMGMAAALGVKFLDNSGNELDPVGENLIRLHMIDEGPLKQKLKNTEILVLCDVINPLTGMDGAAYVYAPQKGADQAMVKALDLGLQNFASVVEKETGVSLEFPGAGAAGGLGAGAKVFLRARFQRGIEYIMAELKVPEHINQANVVITGEGKMDKQTLSGKVVAGVAKLANQHHKPVIALVGKNELSDDQIKSLHLSQVISLVNKKITPTEAMAHPVNLIQQRIQEELNLTQYRTE